MSPRRNNEHVLAVESLLDVFCDDVTVMKLKYRRGEDICYVLNEVDQRLSMLRDALDKNADAATEDPL